MMTLLGLAARGGVH